MRVIVRDWAWVDVQRIYHDLMRERPGAAKKFSREFLKLQDRLRDFPRMAPVIHTLSDGAELRVKLVPGFPNLLAFYTVRLAFVEILRVIHGAQDWQTMMGVRLPSDEEDA